MNVLSWERLRLQAALFNPQSGILPNLPHIITITNLRIYFYLVSLLVTTWVESHELSVLLIEVLPPCLLLCFSVQKTHQVVTLVLQLPSYPIIPTAPRPLLFSWPWFYIERENVLIFYLFKIVLQSSLFPLIFCFFGGRVTRPSYEPRLTCAQDLVSTPYVLGLQVCTTMPGSALRCINSINTFFREKDKNFIFAERI